MNPAARDLYASIAVALARIAAARVSDRSVHEARRALKRARAALRLLRPGLDPAAYRAQNALLRDAGRSLAPLREARAARDALRDLQRRWPEARGTSLPIRPAAPRAASRPAVEAMLRSALVRAAQRDFEEIAPAKLGTGLRRIYRKGRHALAAARKSGEEDALHEWRKHVKYLANGLRVLFGEAPEAKVIRRAERLADRLGEAHDLALLSAREPALEPFAGKRRAKLRKRAFALGRKLYRQKPKRFLAERPTSSS